MRIKVKSAKQGMWYDECIGLEFYAWQMPFAPGVYFICDMLFILGEDVEVIKE